MGLFYRNLSAGVSYMNSSVEDGSREGITPALEANRLLENGIALEQQGQIDEALRCYEAATIAMPELARAHFNRGTILLDRGDTEMALAAFEKTLEYKTDSAAVYYNLGNAHLRLGQAAAAIVDYQHALALKPDFPDALAAQGSALENLGRSNEAIASYRQALEIRPNYVEVHRNLALLFKEIGRLDDAIKCYRILLELSPDKANAHFQLGSALHQFEQYGEALANYRQAIVLQPDHVDAHSGMGVLFHATGQFDQAIDSYRKALRLQPDLFEVHGNLGNVFKDMRRLNESVMCYQRVLELQPNDAKAHNNLGTALSDLGRLDEALDCYRRALVIDPFFDTAHSNLLFTGNLLVDQPHPLLLAEARQYGARAMQRAQPFSNWKCSPDPNRRMRVGFVSGDMREHPVGHFLEGVLAVLESNAFDRLEVFAYPTFNSNDEVALRLKSHCQSWFSAMGLSDQDFAQRIRDDKIDILIDLSGHTAHNRLPIFAWNPAPVQVTWLGYLATTGVTAIDYILADAWTLPESEEDNFTETVWRLPQSYLCFTPPRDKVHVGLLPALQNGYITFGSFNNLAKINDAVVALWSRVLLAVRGSRLYLKSPQLGDIETRQHTLSRFKLHGVDEGRLTLVGLVPRVDYVLPFHKIDIALDPFPYPGITTSVESLWMGVPVLTLEGNSFLSRQGVGLMMNAGLPDWIAADPDDYVARAIDHASNVQGLAELRAGLRDRLMMSPIFDALQFSQHFEAALRCMWQKSCAEQVALPKISSDIPQTKQVPSAFSELINLHIGGKETKEGWKILNALDFEGVDFVGNVRDLSDFPSACCAKVYASHVMEHVGQQHFLMTLQGIHRVLSTNGEFYFSVPDLESLCRLFLDPKLGSAERFHVMRMMYGGQIDDFDFHYIGLTHEFMLEYFSAAGFSNIKRVASFGLFNDTSDYRPYGVPISLNLIARK